MLLLPLKSVNWTEKETGRLGGRWEVGDREAARSKILGTSGEVSDRHGWLEGKSLLGSRG